MQATHIARWVALGALFLIPFTPLIVANAYFFPFITGKAYFFRILVEIAVGAWLVLAALDVRYRPRFSWIGAAALVFVVWMFVADLFAVNVLKAFWSNFERMEGWVLLAHLFGFFAVASAVLRVEEKWRLWFLTSLGISILLVFHALLQLAGFAAIHQGSTRIDSSLGNSAYFAIYLLFNVFIAGWLALTETRAWLKYGLLALASVEAVLIFFTETRGTVLALIGGLALAAFLTALTGSARARRLALVACMALALASGTFYLSRDSTFVQQNNALRRVASISLKDGETRFTIWHMAYEGFKERPVLGWGQEGFNYVFNKYYDSSLYKQEPWFDRAHNAFVDWLMAGGLPAFLLYLSLFGVTTLLLWRNSTLSRAERVALTAVLAGYACHNLFVFDNLYSYIYFFAILALVDSQVSRPIPALERMKTVGGDAGSLPLAVGAAVVLVLIFTVNVPGMRAATGLITAISPSELGVEGNLAAFNALVEHPVFAMQEVREQIISSAATVVSGQSATDAVKQQFAALAVSEMEKQDAEHPGDARTLLQLSAAYRTAGDLPKALDALKRASELSPRKEQIYIQMAATEWDLGDAASARAHFEKAYELGPQFTDLAAYAAAGNFIAGDRARASALLKEKFGTTTVDSDILAYVYYRTKSYGDLIRLWQLRVNSPEATANTWFSLAAAYFYAGDRAHAISLVEAAIVKYPDAGEQGKAVIAQIKSAPSPQ